ncbi:K(+)-transporting ATPase subunit F [Bradyrhizobium sp. 159]|nr:K(+)-transporting ATPase subunit F [Bradyrhizobium sp. 159]
MASLRSRSATPTSANGCEGADHGLRLCARRRRLVGLLVYLTYALLRPERF